MFEKRMAYLSPAAQAESRAYGPGEYDLKFVRAVIDELKKVQESQVQAAEDKGYYIGERGCPSCGGGLKAFRAILDALSPPITSPADMGN